MVHNLKDSFDCFANSDCCYSDMTSLCRQSYKYTIIHINIRSLRNKSAELELLLTNLDYPKVLLITETWLNNDTGLLNIPNYTLLSSHRTTGHGGGVGAYVDDSVAYTIKCKSSDSSVRLNNIDYLMLVLGDYKLAICCMYCPPKRLIVT